MAVPNYSRPESDGRARDLSGEAGGTLGDEPADPPPEEQFWSRYNAHLEFPIGAALSVLAHVLIVAVLVFALFSLMNAGGDKRPVSVISLGDDDSGAGSLGGGGADSPIQIGEPMPADLDRPELPKDIAAVKDDLEKKLQLDDPSANTPIPDAVAAALGSLDKDLQDKLMGLKKGHGPGSGSGDESGGAGPGGTGSDSTRARGLRWIIRFNTRSGQDYLAQLKAMKAVVMIPVPPDNKKMILVRDPGNPRTDQFATDADLAEQANKMQFSDVRKESNEAIAEALRLRFTPSAFWAFFPKGLEEEMARLETAYQNKRADDIKETVFQVVIIGGDARLRVVVQRLK